MEDCCAVCAEPLEWIGYGPCGHREVCFTCIARLRFVLNDKHCCICKQQCQTVYVTKALGDYTRVVTDWKSLLDHNWQANLWYDNVVEAYFDDEEPFKIIKAMCRLYCSVCERAVEGEPVAKGMMKKGYTFKNIDSLRRHQTSVHKVFMCELCLEGRKVFICEQKLYSKSQLDQHSRRGDSEVDGNEEERGGFAGHPMCDFCRQPFYGDNELYQHMSQEHYTCHICQRARPGHYEYYRNYDDLEAHFRQEHLLCENPECLAKKFIVFPSDAELKRHNATTHGGHMSRSQRNAALQIPVSFHYRRPGQDSSDDNSGGYSSRRGGRSRGGHQYTSNARNDQLGAAVLASVESANLENAVRESLVISPVTDESVTTDTQGALERPNIDHLEGVTSQVQGDADIEPSRYLAAVWGAGPSALGDAAFPPLPGTSKSARRRAKLKNQGPASMAALLGGNGSGGTVRAGIRVLNAADNRSSPGLAREFETAQIHQGVSSRSLNDSVGPPQSRNALTAIQPSPVAVQGETVGGSNIRNTTPSREMGMLGKQQGNQLVNLSLEDIRAANKALVERIRAGLEGNEQRFADFKEVSSLFRKGEMSSKDYHVHIARLGLSFVVPELARLCPDPRKGKELLELHAAQLTNNVVDRRSLLPGLAGAFSSSSSLAVAQPVKGFGSDSGSGASGSGSSNFSVRSNVSLGTSSRADANGGVVEVLSTDGYRTQKGKSIITDTGGSSSGVRVDVMPSAEGTLLNELAAARDRTPQVLVRAFSPLLPESSHTLVSVKPSAVLEGGWPCGLCTLVNTAGSLLCAACRTIKPGEEAKSGADSSFGSERKKKKSSKFQRVRLGDGSASALLDSTASNPWGRTEVENESKNSSRSQGRGVWNNGGGQRLVSLAQRDAIISDAWNRGR